MLVLFSLCFQTVRLANLNIGWLELHIYGIDTAWFQSPYFIL